MTGCSLFSNNDSTIYKKSFEPITGKFVLYQADDERFTYTDTYFDIDGSKGNFSLKYYENGSLKKEGQFQRIVTWKEKIGKIYETLHFNVKCSDSIEHISTYTESLDPINQFRILEEYNGNDEKYYLSELPFVLGTYVREGQEYKAETLNPNETDYLTPTSEVYTSALNGTYKLNDDTYFYFVFPKKNSLYAFAYFQYYAPSLEKPLEGFAQRIRYNNNSVLSLYLTYSKEVLFDKCYKDLSHQVLFGYYTFDEEDNMFDHWGTVDFSNGQINSLTFEHCSRNWTDEEWDLFTKDQSYHMPDPIDYRYIGGTYSKV